MQTLDQKKQQRNKGKIKKSQIYIVGSLLILLGIITLSFNHLKTLRNNVYEKMKQLMYTQQVESVKTPSVEQIKGTDNNNVVEETPVVENFDKYLGILEIPKIRLKKGFYNVGSRYNNVEYNVTVVNGSAFPNVKAGNLILIAHSGDAYISYFRYLYKLQVGDSTYVTYDGRKYEYKIVNIYNVPKNGQVTIERNYDITTLTLITCTNNDDTQQTVYIAELVN